MARKASSYEGRQTGVRRLKTPAIEVWTNQYPERDVLVHLDIPEFTCVCPKTGLPDFAVVHVDYRPGKVCLELKSLKMYMLFFRDVGVFHEHLVSKLLDDMVAASAPRWMKVTVVMNPRGGITTTVSSEYNGT